MVQEVLRSLPLPLIGLGMVVISLVGLTYIVVKISRQGGLGTMVIWLILIGVSAGVATFLAGAINAVLQMTGGGHLGTPEDILLVYCGAFCGLLVQGIYNGIMGKGSKVKVEN